MKMTANKTNLPKTDMDGSREYKSSLANWALLVILKILEFSESEIRFEHELPPGALVFAEIFLNITLHNHPQGGLRLARGG